MRQCKWIFFVLSVLVMVAPIGVAAESCQSPLMKDAVFNNLQAELESLVTPMLAKGKVSVYFKSLTDDRVIYEVNAEEALIPASNQKIVTSIGTYYLVRPEYRYRTELYMDERLLILDGMYFGDVAIKGYGDPMFQYPALIQMLKESPLVEAKDFRGQLYIDDTVFDAERFNPDWNYEFVKEIGAIIFRDTTLAKFGDPPATVPTNVGRTVQMIFRPLKITQKGQIFAGESMPDGMKLIAAVESEPMLTIMGYGNKASDNSILEQMFKTISAVKLGQGSVRGSAQVLQEFYADRLGLDPAKYVVRDGSGLSRKNLISAHYLAKMLEYAYFHPDLEKELTPEEVHELVLAGEHPYLNTLAIAGDEGTLSERMIGLQVYGKTGTLNGVDSLSGVLVTATGNVVVFSILVNDFTLERGKLRNWEDGLVRVVFANY